MMGWFKNLSDGNKIAVVAIVVAIVAPVGIALYTAEKPPDNPKRKAAAIPYIKTPKTKLRRQLPEPVMSRPSLKGIHDPNK